MLNRLSNIKIIFGAQLKEHYNKIFTSDFWSSSSSSSSPCKELIKIKMKKCLLFCKCSSIV